MADDTIQLVDKLCAETECCICNETFSDPRILPCAHTFCYKCLQRLASKLEGKSGDKVSCPVCRKGFSISTEGMDDLPKHITMQRLIALVEESSSASNPSRSETVPYNSKCLNRDGQMGDSKDPKEEECTACKLHPSKKTDIYCVGCKALICLICLNENHKSHDWSDTEKAAKKFLVEIENTVQKIEGLSEEIAIIRDSLKEEKQDLIKQLAETEKMIRDRDTALKELVSSNANCLIDELSSVEQKRFKEVDARMDEIERHMLALETFSVHCRGVVSWKSNSAICSAANASLDQAQELKRAHESHLQRKIPSVKVFFKPSDVGEGQSTNNIVGQLEEKERNFAEKLKDTLWTPGLVTCISIIVLFAAFLTFVKISTDVNPKLLKRIDEPCTRMVGLGLFQNSTVVLCNFPQQIILYQNGIPERFNFDHRITHPLNMVVASDYLFVSDYNDDDDNFFHDDYDTKCIWKIMKRERWSMEKWLCNSRPIHVLSTTTDGNVIVVNTRYFGISTSPNFSVSVHNTDGNLLLSFMLPEKIKSPNHILQLRNRNFIISYGQIETTSGICELSPKGHIVRCFIPTSTEQKLFEPRHIAIDGEDRLLVADFRKEGVVILNSNLTWNRVIFTKHEHSIDLPYRLCYDKHRKLLLVGQYIGDIYEFLF